MKINGLTSVVSAGVGLMMMFGGAWAYVDTNFVRAGDFQRLEKSIDQSDLRAIDRELFQLRRDLQTERLPANIRSSIERRVADLERQKENIR